MNRQKIMKLLGMFLVIILIFTLLSRGADGLTKAGVQTGAIQNRLIVHSVTGSGKVEGCETQAVFAPSGRRIQKLYVTEGQMVAKGEPLFQVDVTELSDAMEKLDQEIQALELTKADLESGRGLAEEEKQRSIERAEQDYQLTLEKGDISIGDAQDNYQTGINKLNAMYAAGSSAEEIQAQREQVNALRQTLNQTIIQRNDSVKAAERALEDAKEQSASDSTLEKTGLELLAKQKEQRELCALREGNGEILCPEDGLLSSLQISLGGRTSDEAAAILTLSDGSFRVKGSAAKEQEKYLSEGAEAILRKGSRTIEGAVVEELSMNTDSSLIEITLSVPSGDVKLGDLVEFTVSVQEGPYAACIPLEALHENQGESFVYVLETASSVLGEELVARKKTVQVLDKNESFAALSQGGVSVSDRIIVSADREIQNGSRVRVEEGE